MAVSDQEGLSLMELARPSYSTRIESSDRIYQPEFWPLDQIDPKNSKFPCCVVWTPLPVVSWLAPFIGHVGICQEDGAILDFSGSFSVNVNEFAFGSVARYLQLDREQCCFPPTLSAHTCKHGYKHTEYGTAITWDDALHSSMRSFEHKSYNLFTCNSHSFIAHCLNRLCYGSTMKWNMISAAGLILLKGQWVDGLSVLRAFLPFVVVTCLGIVMGHLVDKSLPLETKEGCRKSCTARSEATLINFFAIHCTSLLAC